MNRNTNKLMSISSNLLMAAASFVCLVPFYLMLMMSTYSTNDLNKGKVFFLPGQYLVNNFKTVIESDFVKYYLNSFYVAALSTIVSIFVSALTGYALAKFKFKLRKPLLYFILMTMMVPSELGLIAYVIEMRMLKLNTTHAPLILTFAAFAYGVFFMTQFMRDTVPDEVIESGRIDGCSEPGIFFRIVLGFIKPAIITLSMFVFLWSWNGYLLPLIIINKEKMYTLPLGIATLDSMYSYDYGAKILGLTLGTIPMLLIFSLGSKTFIRGLAAGAVKG